MYNYDIAKTFFCCKTVYIIDIHDVNNLQILRIYFKALTEIIENLELCVFLNTYRAILSCFKWFLPQYEVVSGSPERRLLLLWTSHPAV